MGQTVYRRNQVAGLPGSQFDDTGSALTAINLSPEVKQLSTFTVNSGGVQTFTIRINGVDSIVVGESGDSAADVAAALVDRINNNNLVSGVVVAELSSASVLVTSRFAGRPFTGLVVSGDITAVATIANAQADPIPYGSVVVKTGVASGYGEAHLEGSILCGIASTARLEAQVDNLTLTYDATVDALVSIRFYDPVLGDWTTRAFEHTQATDAETSVNALVTAINAAMPANTILASSPSAGVLRLTAEIPGAPFELDYGFGPGVDTGVWAHTTNRSALTDLDQAILGLAQYTAVREHLVREPTQGVHPAASPLNVRHDGGKLFVASEDAPAGSSRVYVRIAANGSLDQLGALRATPNAGCVLSRRLRWHKHYPAEVSGGVFLAVVQID